MSINRSDSSVGGKDLLYFFLLTFALSWGILGSYIFLPDQTASWFGDINGTHPLFFLAVWSPGIAAVVLVIKRSGWYGLRRFSGRLLLWRISKGWLLLLVLGLPAVFYLGAWIKGGSLLPEALNDGLANLLLTLLIFFFLGPVEELGWRGVALPLLQRYLAPFWAGLLIGLIWAIWHLPAFFLAGTLQSDWNFVAFLLGVLCLSVLVTPLYNAGRGSLFFAWLFHYQAMNPLWPDAQPYDSYLLVILVVLVLFLAPKAMFDPARAHTDL